MENLISALGLSFVALFPLINPVGAIPVFCSLTADTSASQRQKIAFMTSLNVLIILLVFYFVGEFLLEFFGISLGVLKIAGGLIVAHTAWEMLNSKKKLSEDEDNEVQVKDDISFTPMALPLLSGPGAIGVAIGLSIQDNQFYYSLGICLGIFLNAVIVLISLLLSTPLFKILGKTGVSVLNKIMGFFILAIAVQLIVNGIKMLSK